MSVKRKQERLEEKLSIVIEQVSIQNGYLNKLVEMANSLSNIVDELQRKVSKLEIKLEELEKEIQRVKYNA